MNDANMSKLSLLSLPRWALNFFDAGSRR